MKLGLKSEHWHSKEMQTTPKIKGCLYPKLKVLKTEKSSNTTMLDTLTLERG